MRNRIIVASVVASVALHAASFTPLSGALKQVLPAGQKAFKTKFVMTGDQAKLLNGYGHGDFLEDDAVDVYYTKDAAGKVSGVAVQIQEYLVRWKSSHTWVVGLTPDGKLTGIAMVELTDKYAFPLAKPDFLKQFPGKDPGQMALGKGMDGISGASESCQLLSSSLKRVAWIASHAELK